MTRLILDAEALEVESFSTAVAHPSSGDGVHGGSTLPDMCISFTCGDSHIRACLEG